MKWNLIWSTKEFIYLFEKQWIEKGYWFLFWTVRNSFKKEVRDILISSIKQVGWCMKVSINISIYFWKLYYECIFIIFFVSFMKLHSLIIILQQFYTSWIKVSESLCIRMLCFIFVSEIWKCICWEILSFNVVIEKMNNCFWPSTSSRTSQSFIDHTLLY